MDIASSEAKELKSKYHTKFIDNIIKAEMNLRLERMVLGIAKEQSTTVPDYRLKIYKSVNRSSVKRG
jgi:hypothetical protein